MMAGYRKNPLSSGFLCEITQVTGKAKVSAIGRERSGAWSKPGMVLPELPQRRPPAGGIALRKVATWEELALIYPRM